MNPTNSNQLRKSWLEKENIELMQKRRRRYLHFDKVIIRITRKIFNKITNTSYVKSHSFFPLIRRDQENRIYKFDAKIGKRRVQLKPRPICYASHFDALIYSWYAFQLQEQYEQKIKLENFNESVIAYRSLGKSNVDLAKEVIDFVSKRDCSYVVALDIEGFYDNLNWEILKQAWSNLIENHPLPEDQYKLFKSLTKSSYVYHSDIIELLKKNSTNELGLLFLGISILDELRKAKKVHTNITGKGIPQGTPISCVLSNIYMFDFDKKMRDLAGAEGMYRRYSDDILIVLPEQDESLLDKVNKIIAELKLTIQEAKTEQRLFSKNNGELNCIDIVTNKPSKLQYLGIEFDGKNTLLRHKGYAKYQRRMTNFIKQKTYKQRRFKAKLNVRQIYEKFSPLGSNNYIKYGQRASEILNREKTIKKQVDSHRIFKNLKRILNKNK